MSDEYINDEQSEYNNDEQSAPLPPADDGPIDWDSVRDEIAVGLVEDAKAFLAGEQADLQQFAAEISADMVQALQLGRADLVDELKAQLRTRAEVLRIRAADHSWASFGRTVQTILNVGFKLLATV